MIKRLIRYLARQFDEMVPDLEPSEFRKPALHEGDLIENVHSERPHVLLDINPQKALIVRVYPLRGAWVYDVLVEGTLYDGVSSHLVESDWRLSPNAVSNDTTEQSN